MLIPAAGLAEQEIMTAIEIKELLPSNTLSGKNEKQSEIHVYHDPTGAMEGKRRKKGIHFDSGTWTITDEGQYCRQWERWREKALGCFYVYRLGDNRFRLESVTDLYESRVKVEEGDPQGLKVN